MTGWTAAVSSSCRSLVFTWSADQRRSTGLHRKVPSSVHSTILRTPHQGELLRFRNDVFDCFSARSDALFDLGDGLCTPVVVDCAVTRAPDERGREHQHRGHHSPAPVRRSWSASVTTASTSPARRGARPDRKEAPRRHGDRFSCANSQTWHIPDMSLDCDDDAYGRVPVSACADCIAPNAPTTNPAGRRCPSSRAP